MKMIINQKSYYIVFVLSKLMVAIYTQLFFITLQKLWYSIEAYKHYYSLFIGINVLDILVVPPDYQKCVESQANIFKILINSKNKSLIFLIYKYYNYLFIKLLDVRKNRKLICVHYSYNKFQSLHLLLSCPQKRQKAVFWLYNQGRESLNERQKFVHLKYFLNNFII